VLQVNDTLAIARLVNGDLFETLDEIRCTFQITQRQVCACLGSLDIGFEFTFFESAFGKALNEIVGSPVQCGSSSNGNTDRSIQLMCLRCQKAISLQCVHRSAACAVKVYSQQSQKKIR
jgi:hypothetical protein